MHTFPPQCSFSTHMRQISGSFVGIQLHVIWSLLDLVFDPIVVYVGQALVLYMCSLIQ